MVETRVRKQLALVGWLGALAVGYYFAAHLGLSFRFQHSIIGVVWVANAVLVSALVLTPPARWPLVLMITAAAHVAAMVPVVPAWRIAWQIAGNSVLTISMATVLRRLVGVPLTFSTSRQVLAYMATAFGLAACSRSSHRRWCAPCSSSRTSRRLPPGCASRLRMRRRCCPLLP